MESEKQENEGIRYSLKEREDSAVFLNEKIKKCMEELAVHENRFVFQYNRTCNYKCHVFFFIFGDRVGGKHLSRIVVTKTATDFKPKLY